MSVGISSATFTIPSGAVGDWDFSNYDSSTKTIRNGIASPPQVDKNLTRGSRRMFSSTSLAGGWWAQVNCTVTDSNQAAPDGSTEASTLAYAGGATWRLQMNAQGENGCIALSANNTYTVAVSVKWLGTGSASFKFGANATIPSKTATSSWGRFSTTFVANGSTDQIIMQSPDDTSAANFAVCDFQLYAGSKDLNSTWATAKPLVIQNRDIILAGASSSTVTSNLFVNGSLGFMQLAGGSETLSAYTIVYVGKQGGSPADALWHPCISDAHNFQNFTSGPFSAGTVGTYYNSTHMDLTSNGSDQEWNDYWGSNSAVGTCVMAHTYDGTHAYSYLNGLKVFDAPFDGTLGPVQPSNITVSDFLIGGAQRTLLGGYDFNRIMFWDRALSDDEMHIVYLHLKARYSLTPPRRLVVFVGDSITYGAGGKPFPYDCCPNLSPLAVGVDFARSGAGLSTFDSASTIDRYLTQKELPTRSILVCLFGAADLLGSPGGGGSGYANNSLAPYLDARRAAGWKVVLCTALPRTDPADGGAQFLTNRAAYNSTVRAWGVGLHYDALADTGDTATTMGVDTAPNDASLYQIKVHPTATGAALLEPTVTAAINSIT